MFIQPTAQESKEFTIRTLSNDESLVKERRNRKLSCPTYAKEQTYAVTGPLRLDSNTGVRKRQRKESYK